MASYREKEDVGGTAVAEPPMETIAQAPVEVQPILPVPLEPKRGGRRRIVFVAVLIVAIVAALIAFWPRIHYAWTHVSTDDATVNSHVTYLSARVEGVATDVLVDDNAFVTQGQILVRLDPAPFQLIVGQRQAALAAAKVAVDQQVAALDVARAELEQARSQARGELAGLRGSWYLLATVQDMVRFEVASLQSSVANLKMQQSNLVFAQQEYDRAQDLPGRVLSQEEVDRRAMALKVAREQVTSAEQSAQQTRALLGLQPDNQNPGTVPDDLAQTFSGTQYALAQTHQDLAQLGVYGNALPNITGKPGEWQILKDHLQAIGEEVLVERSPSVVASQARVKQAMAALGGDAFNPAKPYEQASVAEAQKELEQSELQLSYTRIEAPLSGFVSRRIVNPGTHLTAGQTLLAIRPLEGAWVDANFKETQIADLRIGQPVDLRVDAYPDRLFHGRVAGFSSGTGAMLSLLPPENATGNFVKVVQRLPVRIELTEPNPRETPLFAGLSVTPEVDTRAQPTGPDAGQRLSSATVSNVGTADNRASDNHVSDNRAAAIEVKP